MKLIAKKHMSGDNGIIELNLSMKTAFGESTQELEIDEVVEAFEEEPCINIRFSFMTDWNGPLTLAEIKNQTINLEHQLAMASELEYQELGAINQYEDDGDMFWDFECSLRFARAIYKAFVELESNTEITETEIILD